MSNKRPGECEMAHSKRSNVVMREKQNDRMSVFAGYATCTEQPMDLTKKPSAAKCSSTTNGDLTHTARNDAPPVISIDSEEEASDDIGREKLIRKLQDELRNEETKLIFLKQLRYNQRQHFSEHPHGTHAAHAHPQVQAQAHGGHGATQSNASQSNAAHSANAAHSQVVAGRSAHTTNGTVKAPASASVNTVQAHGGASHANVAHSRPQQQQASSHTPQQHPPQNAAQQGAKRTPQTGPVVPPGRSSGQFQPQQSQQQQAQSLQQSHHQQQSNAVSNNQPGSLPRQQQIQNNAPSVPAVPQQPATPAVPKPIVLDDTQKQAARGALRRQLEKTLLAIPPPKPLPPELSFIPSLISNDFVKLLGLEEVVKMLLDIQRQEKRDVKYVFNPFRCSQCKSDFTPVWKREKPGSKNVICEQCVTSNQKRSLRQEHTARLKSAFLKAAEQQQELEEQLKKGHIPSSLAALMPSALQPHSQTPSAMQSVASSIRQHQQQQDRTPTSASIQAQSQGLTAAHQNLNVQNAHSTSAHSQQNAHNAQNAQNAAAAVAAAASQLLPQQLAAAAGMSSPQSLLGMAYIQQQLAALASQPASFGLGSAAVAAAAAALNPAQRQLLLDQLSKQASSFGWKG